MYNSPPRPKPNQQQQYRAEDPAHYISEEVDEGEPSMSTSSQRQRSSPKNNWATRDKQTFDNSYSQASDPNIVYPSGEAYEIVWGQENPSLADSFDRRKASLAERLDNQGFIARRWLDTQKSRKKSLYS